MSMIRSFFFFFVCIACACSCKKSSSHISNSCRISVSYDTFFLASGNETAVTRIFYDNDGRVAYTQSKAGNDSSTRVFIYNDNSFVITPTNFLSPYDTILLNDKGLIARVKQTYKSNDSYDLATYTYDPAGLLQSIAYSQAFTSGANLRTAVSTYTFVNGDAVSETYKDANGTSTTNFTYYTDKASADGDYQSFQNISDYGKVIIRNKHLLRSSQSGTYISDYNYTFDNSGKIATATYRFNNQVIRHTYEYDCTQ